MTEAINWTTGPLTKDRIDQAYPLLHASDPSLTLAAWRTMALAHLGRPAAEAGIVTLRRGGYIHGLFCYHVEEAPGIGRRLRVDVVRVLDIIDQRNAARLMRAAIGEIAHRARCVVVDSPLPASASPTGSEDGDPPEDEAPADGMADGDARATDLPAIGSGDRLPTCPADETSHPAVDPEPSPHPQASRKRRRKG
ncbi:MAG: hypothetical protein RLO50_20355 [Azospirillaceae bacterium]